jgi:hypothetical protein
MFIIAASLLASSPSAAAVPPAPCPTVPAAELMALPYDKFDTGDGPSAWRNLLDRACVDAAVATLVAYREANARRMTSEQKDELSFHIGQTLAFSGRDSESIPHFEASAGPDSTAEWRAYVDATAGFLRKDRDRVERALATYSNVAPGSMRLGVIRGFLKCFDKPYMEAVHCGM